ncbi:hypothetical protein C8J57DRAFT_1493153 [Mycena rebaudengoi]|nr:hypothetical protein C8J57DRAFT_1493153 [Mycena rebaudengoi]
MADFTIDGRPENVKRAAESSLKKLSVYCIDLYYLHRADHKVPINIEVEFSHIPGDE